MCVYSNPTARLGRGTLMLAEELMKQARKANSVSRSAAAAHASMKSTKTTCSNLSKDPDSRIPRSKDAEPFKFNSLLVSLHRKRIKNPADEKKANHGQHAEPQSLIDHVDQPVRTADPTSRFGVEDRLVVIVIITLHSACACSYTEPRACITRYRLLFSFGDVVREAPVSSKGPSVGPARLPSLCRVSSHRSVFQTISQNTSKKGDDDDGRRASIANGLGPLFLEQLSEDKNTLLSPSNDAPSGMMTMMVALTPLIHTLRFEKKTVHNL